MPFYLYRLFDRKDLLVMDSSYGFPWSAGADCHVLVVLPHAHV